MVDVFTFVHTLQKISFSERNFSESLPRRHKFFIKLSLFLLGHSWRMCSHLFTPSKKFHSLKEIFRSPYRIIRVVAGVTSRSTLRVRFAALHSTLPKILLPRRLDNFLSNFHIIYLSTSIFFCKYLFAVRCFTLKTRDYKLIKVCLKKLFYMT